MKYWRGYLVAAIIGACTWGLAAFAKSHQTLIDMVFPYVSRMISGGTAEWSTGVPFCLWQVLLVFAVLLIAAVIVLAILLRWNLVQVTGWIATAVSLVVFLQVGVFDINRYAGMIEDDIHLKVTHYDITELQDAGKYYLDEAGKAYDALIKAQAEGKVPANRDFQYLSLQAADGFHALVYDRKFSVFAGSTAPVKPLGWKGYYTSNHISGVTVNITGESAVNPDVPNVLLPYAMCHEMAHRMSIYSDRDANFSAFLACVHNSDPYFVYVGYLNAYRYCLKALQSFSSEAAVDAVNGLLVTQGNRFVQDLKAIDAFYGSAESVADFRNNVHLLVSWYIQETRPDYIVEEDNVPKFDPMDESQVDLSGLPNDPNRQ